MTHSVVLLLLDALTVFRLTRLVTADTITAPIRDRLTGETFSDLTVRDADGYRLPSVAHPKMAEFITCPWCTSPDLAVIVVALQSTIPSLWIYPAAVLAFSGVAGLLAEKA
jgi:hypothetical protein